MSSRDDVRAGPIAIDPGSGSREPARPDGSVLRVVLRRVPIALLTRGLGAVTGFGFNLLMARRLGAQGSGILQLAITISMASAVISALGLDMAGLRFSSAAVRQGDMRAFKAVYHHASRIALVASLTGTALIVALSGPLAVGVFDEPGLTRPLQLMALTIAPRAMSHVLAAFFRALGRMALAGTMDFLGVSTVALVVVVLAGSDSVLTFATVLAVATMLVWVGGLAVMQRQLAGFERGAADVRELVATAMPLMWAAILSFTFQVADTLILGLLRSGHEVGVYVAVLKVGTIVSMLLLAVNYVTGPQFAGLWHAGEIGALGELARRTAFLMTVAVSPLVVVLIVFPDAVLSVFGAEFRAGRDALIAVALGQFANVATGSVGYILAMSGQQRAFRNTLAAGAALFIVLNLALIPRYGMTGAGIAFGVAVTVQNLLQTLIVRRRLGILVLPIPGTSAVASRPVAPRGDG